MYRNDQQIKSTLIDYMVRSGRDLPWVVEQLKQGNKINQKENFQRTLEMQLKSGLLSQLTDSILMKETDNMKSEYNQMKS